MENYFIFNKYQIIFKAINVDPERFITKGRAKLILPTEYKKVIAFKDTLCIMYLCTCITQVRVGII